MEFYRKCNVCGVIGCYTDEDVKDNEKNALISGISAVGSIASAIGGNRYDMYEMNKMSQKSDSKIINYNKCSNCGSIDTILVTKNFAKFSNKNNGNYTEEQLIQASKEYLEQGLFEDSFCFANMASIENERCYNAYILKLLSTYNVKKIEDLENINEELSENFYYKQAYEYADDYERNKLIEVVNANRSKNIFAKYNFALKQIEENTISSLQSAKKLFIELENFQDSKEKIIICEEKIKDIEKQDMIEQEKIKKQKKKKTIIVSAILIIIILIISPFIYSKFFKKYEYIGRYENDKYYVVFKEDMTIDSNLGLPLGWKYKDGIIMFSCYLNGNIYFYEFEVKDKNTLCLKNTSCTGEFKIERKK